VPTTVATSWHPIGTKGRVVVVGGGVVEVIEQLGWIVVVTVVVTGVGVIVLVRVVVDGAGLIVVVVLIVFVVVDGLGLIVVVLVTVVVFVTVRRQADFASTVCLIDGSIKVLA
jgi:hypothetical protein